MVIRNVAAQAVFSGEKMGKVSLVQGDHLYAGLNCFEPGQEHKAHVHADQDKMYLVLAGSGEITIGEERHEVSLGDLALAPAGVVHAIRNPGPERLVVMITFAPPPTHR